MEILLLVPEDDCNKLKHVAPVNLCSSRKDTLFSTLLIK